MSEIRTAPVTAVLVADWDRFDDELVAGSFYVGAETAEHTLKFWYCCPCGCGCIAPLEAGRGFKPASTPSWNWNCSVEAPTLTPSVHHRGHWHGWLSAGVWKST